MSMDEAFDPYAGDDRAGIPRWRAAGLHFLAGALAAGTLIALIVFAWYPWPLFQADGRGILAVAVLLLAVILGPLAAHWFGKLRPQRTGFDLFVIVMLQVSALVYAAKAVYLARPVYIVFTLDRFELAGAGDLDPSDLAKVTQEQFKTHPRAGPLYVAAVMPREEAEQQRVLFSSLEGKDLNLYPQYYVDYVEQVENVLQRAKNIGPLLKLNHRALSGYLESSGRTQESVKFLPLRARGTDGTVLIDALTGMPLEILLIDPW